MSHPYRGWATAGVQTDPAQDAILADTGPLPAAQLLFEVIVWGAVAFEIIFQHRNAANDATLKSQFLSATWPLLPWRFVFPVATGERVRVLNRVAVVGASVQVSLVHRTLGP